MSVADYLPQQSLAGQLFEVIGIREDLSILEPFHSFIWIELVVYIEPLELWECPTSREPCIRTSQTSGKMPRCIFVYQDFFFIVWYKGLLLTMPMLLIYWIRPCRYSVKEIKWFTLFSSPGLIPKWSFLPEQVKCEQQWTSQQWADYNTRDCRLSKPTYTRQNKLLLFIVISYSDSTKLIFK